MRYSDTDWYKLQERGEGSHTSYFEFQGCHRFVSLFPPETGKMGYESLKHPCRLGLVNIEAPRQEEYIRYELVFFKSLQNPMRVFSY